MSIEMTRYMPPASPRSETEPNSEPATEQLELTPIDLTSLLEEYERLHTKRPVTLRPLK